MGVQRQLWVEELRNDVGVGSIPITMKSTTMSFTLIDKDHKDISRHFNGKTIASIDETGFIFLLKDTMSLKGGHNERDAHGS